MSGSDERSGSDSESETQPETEKEISIAYPWEAVWEILYDPNRCDVIDRLEKKYSGQEFPDMFRDENGRLDSTDPEFQMIGQLRKKCGDACPKFLDVVESPVEFEAGLG